MQCLGVDQSDNYWTGEECAVNVWVVSDGEHCAMLRTSKHAEDRLGRRARYAQCQ